jgi:hypothetical protein
VWAVLEMGAEYTATVKTMDSNSRTETLIADIIKIDLLIIVYYIPSLFVTEYTLDFVFIYYSSAKILNYFGRKVCGFVGII